MIARFLLALSIASGCGPALVAQVTSLPYRPVTAEYTALLNRIVMISGNPNALHIYDPVTGQDTAVPLAQPPLALSISPDGAFAAVGHDTLITYVDLTSAAVVKTYTLSETVRSIALGASWVYVLPAYSGEAISIELATGRSERWRFAYFSSGRLNPAVNAIYGARDGTSPNDVGKFILTDGVITGNKDSPYHGDYPACGPVWFSPDGSRIYTGCGAIYRASTDEAIDMQYITSLREVGRVTSLTEAAGKVALIPRGNDYYPADPLADTRIVLLDSRFLTLEGEFPLRPFTATGQVYPSHGKWLFFSADPNELWAVVQAEAGSGMLHDFAVERVRIAADGYCGAAFESPAAHVGPYGGAGTVKIQAPPSCPYRVVSSAPWLRIVSGGVGAGNGILAWEAAPNPGPTPRAAELRIEGTTFNVTQEAAPAGAGVTMFGFDLVAAEYSKPLDRMIIAGAKPDELHIYDPVTRTDIAIALPMPPLSLSVGRVGNFAAVGHDGWVSYVNLQTRAVERTYAVNTDVGAIVLAPNGYMHLFPSRDWSDIYSLEISTGKITSTPAIYNGRIPRLDRSGKYIYVSGNWGSKWNISGGVAKLERSHYITGNLWVTEDGSRVISYDARAYTASEIPELDLQYNGTFSNAGSIVWADESAERRMTALIPASTASGNPNRREVQFYDDEFLRYRGSVPLPRVTFGTESYALEGQYVFWNRAADTAWTIVKLAGAAGTLPRFGIVGVAPENAFLVSIHALVNAASQSPGRIARGEIVTLYGANLGPTAGVIAVPDPVTKRFPTELGGVQVRFGYTYGALLYVSATQINAIVPYETVSAEVDVQVLNQNVESPPVKVAVAQASPALFTIDGSGSGQAAAFNQNGTLADAAHPAERGSYVMLYFNGGGNHFPSGQTGEITLTRLMHVLQPVAVTVGGVPAEVQFAGAAPGFVNSLGQLNIKLAPETPTGDALPVVLTVGTVSSPATATIAVR